MLKSSDDRLKSQPRALDVPKEGSSVPFTSVLSRFYKMVEAKEKPDTVPEEMVGAGI